MSRYRHHKRAFLSVALCIAALVVSGCSTSDTTATGSTGSTGDNGPMSDCVKTAAANLKPFERIPTHLPAYFTPLAAAPKPGKKIIYLANSNPYEQIVAKSLAEAADAVGWSAEAINFEPTVEDLNAKFMQAISQHPDVIATDGWPIAEIQQSVDAAKKAGIVVADGAVTDVPRDTTGFAATMNGASSNQEIADIEANWVAMDSKCTGHVAQFGLPYAVLRVQNTQFEKTLKTVCPDCKTSYTELQNADIGTPAATNAIVSAVQADPSIKYVGMPIGAIDAGLQAAFAQAGVTDVKIFGGAPATAEYAAMKQGDGSMWVASSPALAGWVLLDAVLRVLNTGKAFPGFVEPEVMLTSDNIPADATENTAYPTDYQQEFKTLWKVGG
jgi:ABC-type sugar transport system substrate-binding protein